MAALKKMLLLVSAALQGACVATPITPSTESMQAAVLIQHSVETSSLLNQAVSSALNGAKVSLASRALTQTSDVQVERTTQDPASMPGLNGQLMEVPKAHHFSLRKQGSQCYLVYQKTGQAFLLEGVKCRVLEG